MINIQPIEKRNYREDGQLEVHSIFNTIQGEGPFTGHRAVFVRLAGCNLQCPSCDTDYTSMRTLMNADEVLHEVDAARKNNMESDSQSHLVVITGGEPFRQDIGPLVYALIANGYRVQVETNGTLAPPYKFDEVCSKDLNERGACFIVCSPKAGKVNNIIERIACAYKYVMDEGNVAADGLPVIALDHSAAPHVARPPAGYMGPIYLQPCDDKDERSNAGNLKACVASCMMYGYTLQLQVHKILGVE